MIRRTVPALLLALAIALAFGNPPLYANGRATLVASEVAGPYHLEISILPSEAIVNNTHVSILLRSQQDESIVQRAMVNVSAQGPELATGFGPIAAPNDVGPPFFEANLPFDVEGEWIVTVEVASDLGQGALQVPMTVHPARAQVNWILMAAILVAIIAVGIWTWDRIRGRRSRNETAEAETE